MKARKLSGRDVAKIMGVNASALSLMLRGHRKITNEEALQLSSLLNAPVSEVLRQAGVKVLDDVVQIRITGYIDQAMTVTFFPANTYDTVLGPADCPTNSYALQLRVNNNPVDGWIYFVEPNQASVADKIGQLCVIATATGEALVGIIYRGYRSGTYNVQNLVTLQMLRTDVSVAWASRIIWIKPT